MSHHCCAELIHRKPHFPLSLICIFTPYSVALSPNGEKKGTMKHKMKAERHTYYFLVISNICLSNLAQLNRLMSLMSASVLLQYGVQQGGCGPTSWQRLQVLQQWRAGWHGAGNVPQCSRTSCHTQSALPPGCFYSLTIHSFSLSLCLSLCICTYGDNNHINLFGTHEGKKIAVIFMVPLNE